MLGMCADWHAPYEPADVFDPNWPAQGELKIHVACGGWKTPPGGFTSSEPRQRKAGYARHHIGLRIICLRLTSR